MSNQQVIETINQQLIQLPEDKLNQVATFVEQLLIASPPSIQKEEFIHSLRGKYANSVTSRTATSELKNCNLRVQNRNLRVQNRNLRVQNRNLRVQNRNLRVEKLQPPSSEPQSPSSEPQPPS